MQGPFYCEVCFALPLSQGLAESFTYIYHPGSPKDSDTSEQDLAVCPQLGQHVAASFGRSHREGWIIGASLELPQPLAAAIAEGRLKADELKELEIIQPRPLFGQSELRLARWVAQYYICSLGEALACILPTGKKEKEPTLGKQPQPGALDGALDRVPARLSEEQNEAIAKICAALNCVAGPRQPFFYLFGPTGSGKTEVFLCCIEQALKQGRGVIYLVPEISLCYQLGEQLQKRFGEPVALLHSHLNAKLRLGYWRSLQQGECRIVLGARSAVFAPVQNLGLIVLDEEHEQSYKAGDSPRYHARQVAMRRSRDLGAVLLMGSATPSVEALKATNFLEPPKEKNQKPQKPPGKGTQCPIELLRLNRRLAGGSFPSVQIIDLRSSKTVISEQLVREIDAASRNGDQAILFLNRRGYSPVVECFACGKVQECRNCSVALTYHKTRHRLKCHHCGFSSSLPASCKYCHQSQLEFVGFGTEQIEEELQRCFGHLRIGRLDADISRKKGQSQKILKEFRSGGFDLLVGTQMVAKGLNFERVQLVGVLLADISLNIPDFRAAERCFSLLVQVAGRAGRFSENGRVIIQTYQPDNQVVLQAAKLDWQSFYTRELELRGLTRYPPFSRLVRLVFRGGNAQKVQGEARQWHRHLAEALPKQIPKQTGHFIELFAPCECPYFRVANKYRYHILLRSSQSRFRTVQHCIQQQLGNIKRNANAYIEVDVDPQSIM